MPHSVTGHQLCAGDGLVIKKIMIFSISSEIFFFPLTDTCHTHSIMFIAKGGWRRRENHRLFFDWLGKQRGFQSPSDYYQLTAEDVERSGGSGLLIYHNQCIAKALETVFPEHQWHPWRFP